MKKLIELRQPSEYRFKGGVIYLNPVEVIKVTRAPDFGESLVYLKDGSVYAIDKPPDEIAKLIEQAL